MRRSSLQDTPRLGILPCFTDLTDPILKNNGVATIKIASPIKTTPAIIYAALKKLKLCLKKSLTYKEANVEKQISFVVPIQQLDRNKVFYLDEADSILLTNAILVGHQLKID